MVGQLLMFGRGQGFPHDHYGHEFYHDVVFGGI
jgi:hypothetical protein